MTTVNEIASPVPPPTASRQPAIPSPLPRPPGPIAQWWIRSLFKCSRNARWAVAVFRPLTRVLTTRVSEKVHDATFANARRLISPTLSDAECHRYGGRVCARFVDFVVSIGRSYGQTAHQMRSRLESVEGHDTFLAARSTRKGAIIVTAHMGSFELGLAALTAIEPHVHVVFKRDSDDQFETIRRSLRQTLGVHEAAIDDGWTTWIQLRDALLADHVVVLQGDRAMPGQRSQAVPFAHGHLRIPLGPLKLAIASGSPIVPIFTLATTGGRCKVFVEPPIHVDPNAAEIDGVHPALLQIGKAIEKYVVRHPDQWLVLHRAFEEDMGNSEV